MSDIVAISADGKEHHFPIGTPQDVVSGAMKRYAQNSQEGQFGITAPIMGPLRSFADRATDMMMLGKKEEILSGMEAPIEAIARHKPLGQAYSDVLARNEANAAQIQGEHPIASTTGAITGAVTGPVSTAAGQFINKGATMLGRATRAILPGAASGAVAGAEGQTLGERAEGAGFGAAGGALLAPIAQVGGEYAGAGLSKLFNFIRGTSKSTLPATPAGKIQDPSVASIMQAPHSQQVSTNDMNAAARELWKRLELDGRDPAKVFADIAAGKLDERSIAGIAGPNVKQMVDTYASMPGRAKSIVAGAQTAAEQGQSPALVKSAAQNLGVKQNYTDLGDVLTQQKTQAGPLYDRFYNVSPDRLDTPFMQNLLKNPLSKELLGTAHLINKIEKAAGDVPDDVFQHMLDAEGNVSTRTTINPRAADYLKRALDQRVEDHIDPMTGKIKGAVGRAWDKLRRAYINHMDDVAPEYKAARDTFAGPAAAEDAMKLGRNILKEDWIGNQKEIEGMTRSEKEALKVGVFQAVDDMLSGISNKADKAARFANIDKYLERMYPAFDSQKSFDAFKRSIMAQTNEFQSVQMAGKGSQSAPRLMDAVDKSMDTAVDTSRAVGGDFTVVLRGLKALALKAGAPGEGQRAAATALALAKGKNALPYLRAIQLQADPRALGTALSGGATYPASKTKAMADLLMQRGQ